MLLCAMTIYAVAELRAQAPQYVIRDLGTLGGFASYPGGINNSGQVTGWSYLSGDQDERAFLFSGGVMEPLGTFGGRYSAGYGLNAAGEITGTAYTFGNTQTHAFRYTNGAMQDLGVLGTGRVSAGYGINNSGQVIGYSLTIPRRHRESACYIAHERHPAGYQWRELQRELRLRDQQFGAGDGHCLAGGHGRCSRVFVRQRHDASARNLRWKQ